MLKLKNSMMLVVAALCGYLALMTPDWKTELQARSGAYSSGLDAGDAAGELLFISQTTGQGQVWQLDANAQSSVIFLPLMSTSFTPMGLGDFDNDGDDDLLIRNLSTGQNTIWNMESGSRVDQQFVNAFLKPNNIYKGAGDFNGDGDADIFWYDTATGQTRVWEMTNFVRQTQVYTPSASLTLAFEGIGDVNDDGIDDIIWRKDNGSVSVWIMGSHDQVSVQFFPIQNTAYDLKGTGDYNGDGIVDLYFRNDTTGQNTVWVMNGDGTRTAHFLPSLNPEAGWVYDGSLDTDGDGDDDVVYTNAAGQHKLKIMQDGDELSETSLPAIATKFSIVSEQ